MRRFLNQKNNFIFVFLLISLYVPVWFGTIYVARVQRTSGIAVTLPVYGSDSLQYKTLAGNLLQKKCFTLTDCSNPDIFRVPGYPLFILLLSFFGGLFAVTFVQIVLTVFTGFLVYKIASLYIKEKWALWVGIIFLIEPSVIVHSVVLLSDMPYVFLIMCATYLLLCSTPSLRVMGVISGLLAVSVYFRPISLYLVPVYVGAYIFLYEPMSRESIRSIGKRVCITVCVFLVCIFPWMIRNYIQTGVFTMSSITSYNLFYYNVPMFLSHDTGRNEEEVRTQIMEENHLTSNDLLKPENLSKISKIATGVILDSPIRYTYFHIYKTTSFFFGSSIKTTLLSLNTLFASDVVDIVHIQSDFISKNAVLFERLFWFLLCVLSLCALMNREHRKQVIVLIVFISYFAILTGPVSYSRYRLPAEPFLLLSAGIGVWTLVCKMRNIFELYKK
jgi:4-amino-4-deoxy-L-arabinose transferase-like glycosyltransferase